MTETAFFRLLDVEIDDKGEALRLQVDEMNNPTSSEAVDLQGAGEVFTADPVHFHSIPKSPFAYWATKSILKIFRHRPSAEGEIAIFRLGLTTNYDFRFLRLSWEVSPVAIGPVWQPFAKGGAYSPYYYDVHLLLDWEDDGERLRQFCRERGDTPSRNIRSESLYFRPGLTWPRRTQKGLNVRALPSGCIFADKGPGVFVQDDDKSELLALLAIMNSMPFQSLVELQMAFGSYEVGVIQRTPIPAQVDDASRTTLAGLALEAHNLQRRHDRKDETTHAFYLPSLVLHREANGLEAACLTLERGEQADAARLDDVQAEIDAMTSDLYGMDDSDRVFVRDEVSDIPGIEDETDLTTRVENLLMWSLGVAFGRWDVRKALDPSLLPRLGNPFDPLPRCAPGALVGDDGLPMSKEDLPEDYPLPIAWDGILVDDPTHPSDIVSRVQGVLDLLWEDRAHATQREICDILGVDRLRDYFRDPRNGFFPFNARRYSKSRRHAPIYWLLQSEERHYAVWLYYHRLDTSLLYNAGRGYADAKVELELGRLENLQQGADTLEGRERRRRYREIERQTAILEDVTSFRDKLDRIALLDLAFDLNDGVLLNIAPLRELVPWKYADRTWKRLEEGEYGWSSMAKQLRKAGLIQSPSKD